MEGVRRAAVGCGRRRISDRSLRSVFTPSVFQLVANVYSSSRYSKAETQMTTTELATGPLRLNLTRNLTCLPELSSEILTPFSAVI